MFCSLQILILYQKTEDKRRTKTPKTAKIRRWITNAGNFIYLAKPQ